MSKSVYEIVTEQIINQLDAGVVPWKTPWVLSKNSTYNRVSDKDYSLPNRMMLGRKGEYATYRQWQDEGFQVSTGERSHAVMFWCEFEDKKADPIRFELDGTPVYPTHPVLRYYNVFHISQTNCESAKRPDLDGGKKFADIDAAEKLINDYVERTGVKLDRDFSCDYAQYDGTEDKVTVPSRLQFSNAPLYYSTVFNVLVRSTGLDGRTGRFAKNGNNELREELAAEIGTACVLHQFGIETEETLQSSASYIGKWIDALSADPRMIVMAASQAEKAVKFLLNETEAA